jgi:hypothetical protein
MDVATGPRISADLHFGKVTQIPAGKMYSHVSADAGMQQHDVSSAVTMPVGGSPVVQHQTALKNCSGNL